MIYYLNRKMILIEESHLAKMSGIMCFNKHFRDLKHLNMNYFAFIYEHFNRILKNTFIQTTLLMSMSQYYMLKRNLFKLTRHIVI